MSTNKISKENASEEVRRFLDFYGIEESEDDIEQQEGFKTLVDLITPMVMKGQIEFTPECAVVQQMSNNDKITYKPVDGGAGIEMDKYKGENAKSLALLGYLSSQGFPWAQKLIGKDRKIAMNLASLFLHL